MYMNEKEGNEDKKDEDILNKAMYMNEKEGNEDKKDEDICDQSVYIKEGEGNKDGNNGNVDMVDNILGDIEWELGEINIHLF